MARRSKSLKRPAWYDALVKRGFTHTLAARISNAMVRKGYKTDRRKDR